MVFRIKRELYDYGVVFSVNVNVNLIKNPAHIVKYTTLPRELVDWFSKTGEYVYIGQDDGHWFISRCPVEDSQKYKLNVKTCQIYLPTKFKEGVVKLDWNCGSDMVWVQTH